MAKVQRSVQYRYLNREYFGKPDVTLEEALRTALAERRGDSIIGKAARARIADLEHSGQLTVWNGLLGENDKSMLAGELLLYKDSFDVTAIQERLDVDDARFELSTFQTDGKNKPVEGALYFAVIKDHVGIIQSNAVTGRWLERYFTWMLKDITGVLEGEQVVNLDAAVAVQDGDIGKLGPARQISVPAAPSGRGQVKQADLPKREFREKAKSAGATVIEVLQLMGFGPDMIQSIQRDIPEGGNLEGDFLVYIKDGRKRQPISVGTLNHAFRHALPGDIAIEQKGSKVRNKMKTLSEPVRVTNRSTGLDPSEAMEQTMTVLYRWGEQGVINLGLEE